MTGCHQIKILKSKKSITLLVLQLLFGLYYNSLQVF